MILHAIRQVAAVLAATACLAGATPASAQDPARGQALSSQACANCHGADGRSQTPGVPSLAGQPADFVTLQMILFREGLRNAPPMPEFARGLSDPDI